VLDIDKEILYNLSYNLNENEPGSWHLPGSIVTVITSRKGNHTMTEQSVPNSTSGLQVSSSPPQQFGRRAYGHQRRMSPHIVARNIAESILTHRQRGEDRPISFYTQDPATQTLVQTKLDAIGAEADTATDATANPPNSLGIR
jgi:hypothetical protein